MTTQEKQRRMGLEVDEKLPPYLFPMGLVTQDELGAPPVGDDSAAGSGELIN